MDVKSFLKENHYSCKFVLQCGPSMTSWEINSFFVLVDIFTTEAVKTVYNYIDLNKKWYVSTKTSLAVHTVCSIYNNLQNVF